jgi:hypothetical protein
MVVQFFGAILTVVKGVVKPIVCLLKIAAFESRDFLENLKRALRFAAGPSLP